MGKFTFLGFQHKHGLIASGKHRNIAPQKLNVGGWATQWATQKIDL